MVHGKLLPHSVIPSLGAKKPLFFSYCQIRFEGSECKRLNFSYHVAFASIFFLLALTSLIQLTMCIHAGN